jgi:alpha-mannosidase
MATVRILDAEATDLFLRAGRDLRQVVRVTLAGAPPGPVTVEVAGAGLRSRRVRLPAGTAAGPVEVAVTTTGSTRPGDEVEAVAVAAAGGTRVMRAFTFRAAEPGWRMFLVPHFHFDAVFWHSQATYTDRWSLSGLPGEDPFQGPGLALIDAHLDRAERDRDYAFVLADVDCLKPYWDTRPHRRRLIRSLIAQGRLELVGGMYNEPDTNLAGPEALARGFVYGVGFQRDVIGGRPATAWQLDVFGHGPQFPCLAAQAGLRSAVFARGPYHEWGPWWSKHADIRLQPPEPCAGRPPEPQFATEFDWVGPGGGSVLAAYLAGHYHAGWWTHRSRTLAEAEREVERLFRLLKPLAATRNVLLPVGTDFSPPNRWITEVVRDWNSRYAWPRLECTTPARFFAAVSAGSDSGQPLLPQSRDMNPVFEGTTVTATGAKQAQREAERLLAAAETLATIAALLGDRYPVEALDKAWRQLLFGTHHDAVTGSHSDQVHVDLMACWREACELARTVHDRALGFIAGRVRTRGPGVPVIVFNPCSWDRTDVARVTVELTSQGSRGLRLQDEAGRPVPFLVEHATRHGDGTLARVSLAFVASDVPAVGYRTLTVVAAADLPAGSSWRPGPGARIANDEYAVEVDPERGGAIRRLRHVPSGRDLLRAGALGNELVVYGQRPEHPRYDEGPWRLSFDGAVWSTAQSRAEVVAERCDIGERITVRGSDPGWERIQEVVLWRSIGRVELTTVLDGAGDGDRDRLFRVRFSTSAPGGRALCSVGHAVVGRSFGWLQADPSGATSSLDSAAYLWCGIGATAWAEVGPPGGSTRLPLGVAEIVIGSREDGISAVRDLVAALARQGVSATVSRDASTRHGCPSLDSNLPDVRIGVGGPDRNSFVRTVLESAPAAAAEVARELAATGAARVWVPASRPLEELSRPGADRRGPRDLPVLLVAAGDGPAALAELVTDLEDAVVQVAQPADLLDGSPGGAAGPFVAVMNRGTPGWVAEADGTLAVSVLRTASGWPKRLWPSLAGCAAPGGSAFSTDQATHVVEYALAGGDGDWRAAGIARRSREFAMPLEARAFAPSGDELPPAFSFARVEPENAVLTALKPLGNPLARMEAAETSPAGGVVFRVAELNGARTRAVVTFFRPLRDAFLADLLEEPRSALAVENGRLELRLGGSDIAIAVATPAVGPGAPAGPGADRTTEPAQPVFARYWRHNKGAAPVGNQPVGVLVEPELANGSGPFELDVTVASSRRDAAVSGSVHLVAPAGWRATPARARYDLPPGGHATTRVAVSPPAGAAPGRYFVAARIEDELGQLLEDVVTVDVGPGMEGQEVTAEPLVGELRLSSGQRARLGFRLTSRAASGVRGEVQLSGPFGSWALTAPRSRGFEVAPGASRVVWFDATCPPNHRSGSWWLVARVLYFGRCVYLPPVWLRVGP